MTVDGTCTCGGAHCPEPAPPATRVTEDLTVVVRLRKGLVPNDRREEIKRLAADGALAAITARLRSREAVDNPDG